MALAGLKILALDTSTEYCSVALWHDGSIDTRETAAGHAHSQLLLPMVDELLRQHAVVLKDLDGIAFGRGPGSFTGLRIACGVTQGLAFGAGLPVVGISTLLALAEAVQAERALCCLDARMGEIYHAAYLHENGEWCAVHEANLCAPDAAPTLPPGAWTGCGGGFAAHGQVLQRRYAGCLAQVRPEVYPHAREIARLGARELEQGRGVSADQALPVYIRDKVALRSDERPA